MSKQKREVIIVMHKDGRMFFDFSGFQGDECYSQAREIEQMMKECGIELEITAQERKEEADNEQPANNAWTEQTKE